MLVVAFMKEIYGFKYISSFTIPFFAQVKINFHCEMLLLDVIQTLISRDHEIFTFTKITVGLTCEMGSMVGGL